MNQRAPSVLLSTLLNIRDDQPDGEDCRTFMFHIGSLHVCVHLFLFALSYTCRGGVIYSQFEVSLELTVWFSV